MNTHVKLAGPSSSRSRWGWLLAGALLSQCGPGTNPGDNDECRKLADEPDEAFTDTNCDGIDGSEATSMFVTNDGLDTNPGTKTQPMRTLQAALAKAVAQGKRSLLVARGDYEGPITLVNGVSIYGGYDATKNWTRQAGTLVKISSNSEVGGQVVVLDGKNINVATVLDGLQIVAGDALTVGTSSYALTCTTCPALTVRNSDFTAGNGAPGAAGTAGVAGMAGGDGGNGGNGAIDGAQAGAGGLAGYSTCDAAGGLGGQGGAEGANPGAAGGVGAGGTPGGSAGQGGDPGTSGGAGQHGMAGGAGTAGSSGSGGTLVAGVWVGTAGGNGTAGTAGKGGGGGGGGGGQGCLTCNNGAGNGGGGGAAGGCPGTGGQGGTAGGASVGIFLVDSTGFTLSKSKVASKAGGAGGAGGQGGTGGQGGNGGTGGMVGTNEIGAGGQGGNGGIGGTGGHGGGGAGGPSYAIALSNSDAPTEGNQLSHGNGGIGGPSMGQAGQPGPSGNTITF